MPYSNELNVAIRAVQDAAVYCTKVQNSLNPTLSIPLLSSVSYISIL